MSFLIATASVFWRYIYLEPKSPLFLKVNLSKTRPKLHQSKQRGPPIWVFQVYKCPKSPPNSERCMEPMSSFLVLPPNSLHLECLDDTVATSDALGDGLDTLGRRKLRRSSSKSCNDDGVEGEVFGWRLWGPAKSLTWGGKNLKLYEMWFY